MLQLSQQGAGQAGLTTQGAGQAVAQGGVAKQGSQGAAGHAQGQAANEVWAATNIVAKIPSSNNAFFIKISFFISLNFE